MLITKFYKMLDTAVECIKVFSNTLTINFVLLISGKSTGVSINIMGYLKNLLNKFMKYLHHKYNKTTNNITLRKRHTLSDLLFL